MRSSPNAKAVTDTLGLYDANMGSGYGGITQTCSLGCSYSVISGRGDMPVNFVSFYDAVRFTNWLHNGQGIGDTEDGAYLLLGGTPTPTNGLTVTRDAGASIFLPTENEWYKAAYYDVNSGSSTRIPSQTASTVRHARARPVRRPTPPTVIGRSAGGRVT